MKPIKFEGVNITYARDQQEYIPLPAQKFEDGRVLFCWQLTWKERLWLLFTGTIWHQVLTFNSALQPQKLSVERPE